MRGAWWGVIAAVAVGWAGAPTPPAPAALAPESCGGCHPTEAAAWRGSRHAVASSNPMFRASWDRSPDGWCLGCHEPSVEGQRALLGAAAVAGLRRPAVGQGRGVGCADCHVVDGVVLVGEGAGPEAEAAHAVRRTGALQADTCARCHEFNFQVPTGPFGLGPAAAQSTRSEWSGSDAAARGATCAGCHLDGHRFPGAHDGALWAGLLDVRVRPGDGVAEVTLSGDLPHRVPTGDPFRRLELRLCGDGACDSVVGRAELRRSVVWTGEGWEVQADDTLPPSRGGVTSAALRVPVSAPPEAWELWLWFGERRLEPLLPPSEARRRVAAGLVGAAGPE